MPALDLSRPGCLQDRPLLHECMAAAVALSIANEPRFDPHMDGIMGCLEVLRRRGLLNVQGVEIVKEACDEQLG